VGPGRMLAAALMAVTMSMAVQAATQPRVQYAEKVALAAAAGLTEFDAYGRRFAHDLQSNDRALNRLKAAHPGTLAGYRLWRKREGMGGGDPKLFGAIGLWLGWRMLPAVLLLAALTGLAFVLLGMLRGRAAKLDDRMPFGALLAIAAYPAWLFLLGLPA